MNAQHDILEFQGEYRWLSNFWPAEVVLDGVVYPSVENAYQAAKFLPNGRDAFRFCSPGQAKRLARNTTPHAAWMAVRVSIMRSLIQQKFVQGSALAERLLNTGDVQIVEGNKWNDRFWGVCGGTGQNVLGHLIMAQRTELRMFKHSL